MNSKTALLFCLFILCSPLIAQDDGAKAFRVLGWGAVTDTLFFTQSELPPPPDQDNPIPLPGPDYKETKLHISVDFRSPFYKYDPSKPIKIVKHEGSKIVLVSSLDFSAGPAIPLVLFTQDSNKFYKLHIINDDPSAFPWGSFMIFNFSHVAVSPQFKNQTGTTSITVQPNDTQVVKPSFTDQAVTEITVRLPPTQKLVYSSNWILSNGVRNMLFFDDNPLSPASVHFLKVADRVDELVIPKSPQ